MSKASKYSDRTKFFFAIFGKNVLQRGIMSRIRSRFHFSGSKNEYQTLDETHGSTQEDESEGIPETQYEHKEDIKKAFNYFLSSAGSPLDSGTRGSSKDISSLLMAAISKINETLDKIDNTWLQGYGLVLASSLKMIYLSDLLDVVECAHKFISPYLKPLAIRITNAWKSQSQEKPEVPTTPEDEKLFGILLYFKY